jgi:radical SAM protein with 4Fe4S-binding SPASM domain
LITAAAASNEYRPLSAMVELTHRCHLACVHCYLDDNHDWAAKSRELGSDEVMDIVTQLRAAGCMFLTFSGGETFLRPDLLQLLRHARGLGLAVTLFTTGTLLREEQLPELAKLYLRGVEVSLYSADPTVHDAITQKRGSHSKTLAAVRRLRAHAIPVAIKCPLMQANADSYAGLKELAAQLQVRLTVDPEVTTTNAGCSSPLQQRLSPTQLASFYAEPELRPRHGLPEAQGDAPICAIGKRSCIIGPYGDVYTCLGYQRSLGNLREHSFAEIWRDTGVLAQLRRLRVRDLPVCGSCEKSAYCGRCAGSALAEHGAFDGPSHWACTQGAAKEQAAGLPVTRSAAERLAAPPKPARRALPVLRTTG